LIRKGTDSDFEVTLESINDAAQAYKGVIPIDCWHELYMSREELKHEIEDRVCFWGFQEEDALVGVMGIQDKGDVTLIRHAYVRSNKRNQGIGTLLLRFLESTTQKPVLIGTWADATWAIAFYKKNGYRLLSEEEKNQLLRKYWTITERQVVTSLVLANKRWTTPTSN